MGMDPPISAGRCDWCDEIDRQAGRGPSRRSGTRLGTESPVVVCWMIPTVWGQLEQSRESGLRRIQEQRKEQVQFWILCSRDLELPRTPPPERRTFRGFATVETLVAMQMIRSEPWIALVKFPVSRPRKCSVEGEK